MGKKKNEIKFLDDYILLANDKIKYDIKPLFTKIPIFNKLKENELFKKGKIDKGGYGIVWTDDIDLSADEILKNE